MKKFLWITGMIIVAALAVYATSGLGTSPFSFLSAGRSSGGFEAVFDAAVKEIAANQNLAAPACFTVSSFENGYEDSLDMAGLIETEMRNSMAQAMPGRVTAYRFFKKAAKDDNDKKELEKEKLKKQDKAKAAKPETQAKQENSQQGTEQANENLLANSGNFIVSGTFKEEDDELVINLYVSDAENGRGYYARRISVPLEKLPSLCKTNNKKNNHENDETSMKSAQAKPNTAQEAAAEIPEISDVLNSAMKNASASETNANAAEKKAEQKKTESTNNKNEGNQVIKDLINGEQNELEDPLENQQGLPPLPEGNSASSNIF